jgi:hypothetical protein
VRGERPLPRVRQLDVPFPVSGGSAPHSSLSSSFSHDQHCRSLFSFTSHTRAPTGFLRLPPRRPSDALEREEAKAAGRARSRAAPPLPPSAASPAPLRQQAARLLPCLPRRASCAAPRLPPSNAVDPGGARASSCSSGGGALLSMGAASRAGGGRLLLSHSRRPSLTRCGQPSPARCGRLSPVRCGRRAGAAPQTKLAAFFGEVWAARGVHPGSSLLRRGVGGPGEHAASVAKVEAKKIAKIRCHSVY